MIMKKASTLLVLWFALLVLMTKSSPVVQSDILKFEQKSDSGTTQIEVQGQPEDQSMEETIKSLYHQIENLDVKALYQRRVVLEKLINDTDSDIAKHYPKYVVTREDKVYFFTDTAPTSRPKGTNQRYGKGYQDEEEAQNVAQDPEASQLEALLQLAKKHTNNPPAWPWKKSVIADDESKAVDVDYSNIKEGTSYDSRTENLRALEETLRSLQSYIDKLKKPQN